MNRFKLNSTVLAAALTMLIGAPAVADDTELLLVNPLQATAPKPNILFILDTSGSMGDPVSTRQIYDANEDYSDDGSCDPDYYYWTEVDIIPSCDSSNTRKFLKSAFVCEAANRRLDGIGRYTDTMAQFRDGASGFFSVFLGLSSWRWQQIEPGNETDTVECADDRGEHGDGVDGSKLYALRGGQSDGTGDKFTADEDDQVPWGSWPTSQVVTIFDGNYLNYRANPVVEDVAKENIMRDVTKAVLASVDNVNVGIMRFNDEEGGPVILGMTDLDANRTAVNAAIDSLDSDGFTPLAETLYESARYWQGLEADFGKLTDHTTDPAALKTSDPMVYQAPASNVCTKNYNVLLTDGIPVRDDKAPAKAPNLPGWFEALGRTNCTGTAQGDCLDDIAEYLAKRDISTEVGEQNVTTHTIGFAIDLPILQATADASEGRYFKADNVEDLTLALLEVVEDVQERSLSFAAPAVAVNTFNRTRTLNDLYLTTFGATTNTRWPGNLKKYKIKDGIIVDANEDPAVDPNTGFFDENAWSYWGGVEDGNDVTLSGAASQLPASGTRKLYTNKSINPDLFDSSNHISQGNKDSFTLADFGLTGSTDEPTKEQIIDWARGVDVADEDFDGNTTEDRKAMGDPLHSKPAAVVYGGTEASPVSTIFTATNEGYVHAIDAATGEELWAFIPKEHTPNLVKLFFNPASSTKHYGVDGDIIPVVYDDDGDGQIESADGDFVNIIFGMRRGGNVYYALDVTNRTQPKLKWRVADSGFGQTWSPPTVARVNIKNDSDVVEEKIVAVVGGGYDTVHDSLPHPSSEDTSGNGIYFLDLDDGSVLWRAAIAADTDADLGLAKMTRSIPTQVRVIDLTGDGFADRMYAADMGGQIFRFDIINGQKRADLVRGGVIAQLGREGNTGGDADTRRFYAAPDVSIFNDTFQTRRFISISIGSGYRAHPLDNTVTERFYSVRDPDVFNQLEQTDYNTYDIIKEDDLVEISGTVRQTIGAGKDGWMFTLPSDQKIMSESVTFNNEIFFVSFSPDSTAATQCRAGLGQNFLYRVSVVNGDPIVNNLDTLAASDANDERRTDLAQVGIAPAPQFLFPTPEASCTGAACNPPPLGCIGVECFDPGFANNPVRTLWTQDGIE